MIYRRLRRFREAFANLPPHVQAAAVKAFRLFQENPGHPSLGVKKMTGRPDIWEGRVTRGYRFTFEYDTDPDTGERICILWRNSAAFVISAHTVFWNETPD